MQLLAARTQVSHIEILSKSSFFLVFSLIFNMTVISLLD